MAAPVHAIDEQNPWPWLDPFSEEAQRFFNGRDDDTAALLRMVRGAPVTVLFGKSGLGKTSLLQAGLFPALRGQGLLPVYVRLRCDDIAGSLQHQLWTAYTAECDARRLAYAQPTAAEKQLGNQFLWLYLHRRRTAQENAERDALHPVFVLDQFEEQFTLGARDVARQDALFADLGNLLENRIPSPIADKVEQDESILDTHDFDGQPYKFLLSLREDYLPDLEPWADEMPRLGPNRYRLLSMSRQQAFDAIIKTGGSLVTEAKARHIVDYLTQSDNLPTRLRRGRRFADVQVEPALLSLVCSGLNAKRILLGAAQLDTEKLDRLGGEIIERFYDDRIKPMPVAVHRLIESELITADGVRRQYPVSSALAERGVTLEQIDELVGQRILRKDVNGDSERMELVHDRLAAVALQRRRASEERAALEARRAKQDESERLEDAQKKARHYRRFAIIAGVVLTIGILLVWGLLEARQAVEQAHLKTERALDKAKAALIEAQAQRDEALMARTDAVNALAEVRRLDADNRALASVVVANPSLAKSVVAAQSAQTIVYLQVPRHGDQTAASRLRTQLNENGYEAPAVEEVKVAPNRFELRYFREPDRPAALELADRIKKWNFGNVTVAYVQGYEARSRLKQFEVWFPQDSQSGVASELSRLIDQIDSPVDAERKQAITLLWTKHRESQEAVAQVLALYRPGRIEKLSLNGTFNGLHFLAHTEPKAWTAELEKNAREVLRAIDGRSPGRSTREQMEKLRAFLDALKFTG